MAATAAANAEHPPLRYVLESDFPIAFVVYDLGKFHTLMMAYVGRNS
jgi:hypothetical protein